MGWGTLGTLDGVGKDIRESAVLSLLLLLSFVNYIYRAPGCLVLSSGLGDYQKSHWQAGRQAGFQISYASNFLQCDPVALLLFGLSGLSQASQEALRTLITTVYVKTNVSLSAKFPEPASTM